MSAFDGMRVARVGPDGKVHAVEDHWSHDGSGHTLCNPSRNMAGWYLQEPRRSDRDCRASACRKWLPKLRAPVVGVAKPPRSEP